VDPCRDSSYYIGFVVEKFNMFILANTAATQIGCAIRTTTSLARLDTTKG